MKTKKEWSPTHDQLIDSMQKEVAILRELLANLFQEEVFLSRKEPQNIFLIQEDRSTLLKTLSDLRKQRLVLTRKIQKLLFTKSLGKKLDLEQLLPDGDENTSQALSLREQMRTLFEKLGEQKERNHHLLQEGVYLNPTPALKPKKKKSEIATFEEKR